MAGAGAKLFTSGSVLTAAQVNTYLMDQAVMRFADEAARDAAFGGTGEPVLAEGMFAYTDDTNTLWFYTGSAWEVATIKPSLVDAKGDLLAGTAADTVDRLAVGTNGQVLVADSSTSTGLAWANAGGLTLISSTTIGSAVSSVTVTDAFSATYENYKIIVSGGVASAVQCYLTMTLGASVTGYSAFMTFGEYTAATVYGANQNNAAQWIYCGDGAAAGMLNMNLDLLGPQLAKHTRYGTVIAAQSTVATGTASGIHKVATAYTDFTIAPNTGTITGGTIYVYGYVKA